MLCNILNKQLHRKFFHGFEQVLIYLWLFIFSLKKKPNSEPNKLLYFKLYLKIHISLLQQ